MSNYIISEIPTMSVLLTFKFLAKFDLEIFEITPTIVYYGTNRSSQRACRRQRSFASASKLVVYNIVCA